MPEDKARKRAVRARMAQTGERYTTAARKLSSDGPAALPATCPDCRGAELDFRRTGERSVTVSCRECGSDNVYPVSEGFGAARQPADPPVA